MTNEELKQEIKRLEEQITELRFKILESKAEKKPYEVEVPEDVENYYYVDETGLIERLWVYDIYEQIEVFKRGLAFKTKEEAEQFDKERILLFKLHKWAEEHNKGWKPDWYDDYEEKYYVTYYVRDKMYKSFPTWNYEHFLKLPYFKTKDIAEQFIEEFGDEIKEVLC
ncbi:hypothetical protein [Gemella sp.]